jgi:hypothetical protein
MIGNSIFLAGLVDLVQKQPGIQMITLNGDEPVRTALESYQPHIIIYSRLSLEEKDVTRYITSHSETTAIGLDASYDRAVILSGTQYPISSINDFTNLIFSMIQSIEGGIQAAKTPIANRSFH